MVGDIHGCYQELLLLEKKIFAAAKRQICVPLLLSVGDLCDRGPDSAKVIDHVRRGVESGSWMMVLGNHEQLFLQVIFEARRAEIEKSGGSWPEWMPSLETEFVKTVKGRLGQPDDGAFSKFMRNQWAVNGGTITLKSYGADISDPTTWTMVPMADILFLLNCPIAIDTPHGLVTHAYLQHDSLEMMKKYESGDRGDLESIRSAANGCLWDRIPPKEAVVGPNLWHVSGHTPKETVARDLRHRCIQIDTGCVYGGKLTAIDFLSRRALSVNALDESKRL